MRASLFSFDVASFVCSVSSWYGPTLTSSVGNGSALSGVFYPFVCAFVRTRANHYIYSILQERIRETISSRIFFLVCLDFSLVFFSAFSPSQLFFQNSSSINFFGSHETEKRMKNDKGKQKIHGGGRTNASGSTRNKRSTEIDQNIGRMMDHALQTVGYRNGKE